MSTVITRIMHKLRVGNDAGRVTTDERGQNVWEWNKTDEWRFQRRVGMHRAYGSAGASPCSR